MTRTAARAGRAAAILACLAVLAGCSRIVVLHDPLSAAEHNDLGVAYESAGRMDLAEGEYRRALRLAPGLTRARVNLGNLHARAGRWPQAEREYRRALRREPGDTDALNNLAWTLLQRGRALGEAESLATRALAAATPGRDSLIRATLEAVRAARSVAPAPGRP